MKAIERSVMEAIARLSSQGVQPYGYRIASEIKEHEGKRAHLAYGTLYRALAQLEQKGLLRSTWEDRELAAEQSRPPRKFYEKVG